MMRIKIITLVGTLLLSPLSFASDSWYVVNNYQGTVGKLPVHMSLQTYDFGAYISVKGSYYYDKYRSPIALYGRNTPEGIVLCEVSSQTDFEKYLLAGEDYNLERCPFKLVNNEQGLTGVWRSEKSSLAVSLASTARMDTTHITGSESLEIPFWGQTPTHSFIGRYENSAEGLTITQVEVLDKKQGQIVQVINPQTERCAFGFYMTAVYQNLESMNNTMVSFNCYSTQADISNEYSFDKQSGQYRLDN